ncbi:hypothetical protein ACVIHC_008935 [Bradyrhizobium diazoefficiens]
MSAAWSISVSSRPPRLSSASSSFGAVASAFRQLELLQPGSAEAVDAGMAVGRQADHGQRPLGRFLGLDAAVAALAVEAGERDVLEDGQAAEGARNLEGTADARLMIRCGARPAISCPANRIDPEVGASVPESM